MSVGFGAMEPKDKARALAHDEIGFFEVVYLRRAGKLARPMHDYDPLTLRALLLHWEDTKIEIDRIVDHFEADKPYSFVWYEQAPGAGVDYDVPIVTGDPVVDAWEKDLAEGRIPDDWIGHGKQAKDQPKHGD